MAYANLNPDKGLIWRITHRRNLPWILANGLHAGSSDLRSPDWVTIGNEELIDRRTHRTVPLAPGGMLNDYVPFYFTPFSPMMYNIYTGRGGVRQVANADIVILVSSLYKVAKLVPVQKRQFFESSSATLRQAARKSNLQYRPDAAVPG